MTRVHLVRHGETDSNREELFLHLRRLHRTADRSDF